MSSVNLQTLFYCEPALMEHAIVGRSIITPVYQSSVNRLADELPYPSSFPYFLRPHVAPTPSATPSPTDPRQVKAFKFLLHP